MRLMKLMTFLGLALSVSVPAKAVYVDGGISCNPLYSVDADAVTELEFWEAYWYGFTGSFTDVQIYGPPGGASGSNYANFPSPAIAYASLVPEPGNYQYLAWHSISGGPWGQVLVYFGQASCDVPSAEIDSSWSIEDGDQTTFHVTTLGLTPTGYSWTFSSMGGGNNPNVNFGSPSAASTTTDGHWYANPNNPCTAGAHAVYDIDVAVHFPWFSLNDTAQLTVSVPWTTGGTTDFDLTPNAIQVQGGVTSAQDSNGVWRVTGMGNLAIVAPIISVVHVPQSSQFYSKVLQHEQKHVSDLSSGYFKVTDFYAQIVNFTDSTQFGLFVQISQAAGSFISAELARSDADRTQLEQSAYGVSDLVAPQYMYQNCGRF